jgi:hypothetical protein
MRGSKQKYPADSYLRTIELRAPQKAVQKYRKKPKLVGKLNGLNALFHYSDYRKPLSGVVRP